MYTKVVLLFNLILFASVSTLVQATISVDTANSTVTQLTQYDATDDNSRQAAMPDISRDGSTVVFISDADLVPGSNPDHLQNVFIMDSDGNNLRQLTNITLDPTHQSSIAYYTEMPRVSADGSVVVFSSTANLTGDNPPELFFYPNAPEFFWYIAHSQIFVINSDGSGLRQLSHGVMGESTFPRISHDGTIVAFQSTQDLVGENADGTEEIFVVRADGSDLTQITKGSPKPEGKNIRSDQSRNVSISGDGTTVAFDSFIDLVPPQNDDLSNEIFVFDLAGFWAAEGTIADLPNYTVQVTDTDIDAEFHIRAEDSFEPSLSYDGTWVAFSACINPDGEGILDPNRTVLGNNPFLPDVIFIAKRDGTEMRQLTFSDDPEAYADDPDWTNIDDDAHWPEISDDGRKIVFGSRSKVDIDNVAGEYEIAMIDLDAPLDSEGRPVVEQLTSADRPYVIQLTFGGEDGARLRPSINADAAQIVLRSDSDYTGLNVDGNSEIFMVEPFPIDYGTDDTGTDDTGTDDTGSDDSGSDDSGSDDSGSDDSGSDDTGSDDTGSDDTGSDDTGSDDTGIDDQGSDDQGSDDQGSDDQGSDDQGSDDQGSDDQGTDDQGTDDQGTDDQGTDDQGTDDQGADDQSTDDQAKNGGKPDASVSVAVNVNETPASDNKPVKDAETDNASNKPNANSADDEIEELLAGAAAFGVLDIVLGLALFGAVAARRRA